MARSSFARSLEATLRFEGGFSDHAADPGGATKFGITRATLEDWRGESVSEAGMRALTRAEAAAIYRRNYWELAGCDRLPPGVDLAVFDYAVNSGVDRASRALQSALGVTVDGVVGRDTIAAAERADARAVVLALCGERRGFLRRLRIFSAFGRGWLRRVAAVEALALTMTPRAAPQSVLSLAATKENAVTYSKSIIESRTIWANLVGLAALGASLLGFDAASVDQGAVVDAVLKGVAGFGFVASTIFRLRATKKLG